MVSGNTRVRHNYTKLSIKKTVQCLIVLDWILSQYASLDSKIGDDRRQVKSTITSQGVCITVFKKLLLCRFEPSCLGLFCRTFLNGKSSNVSKSISFGRSGRECLTLTEIHTFLQMPLAFQGRNPSRH